MNSPTPPPTEGALTDKQYEIARDLLIHIEGQATLAVMKSTLLLAAHALLGATYLQIASILKIFEHPIETGYQYLFVFAGILLLLALLFSLLSILPRLKAQPDTALLFYAGISQMSSSSKFEEAFKKTSEVELGTQILANIYGKSTWLKRTFKVLRWSIIFSSIGTIMCVIAFAQLKVHSL
jgi:hypothetical protein